MWAGSGCHILCGHRVGDIMVRHAKMGGNFVHTSGPINDRMRWKCQNVL